MELFRGRKAQSAMDLVQITGQGKDRPVRRVIFELLLIAALSVGCWYTYFSMFPNPVNLAVSIALITGLPLAIYFMCWVPFLKRFMVFYVFAITAVFFVLMYEIVWNGILVMGNIMIEVLNNEMNSGLIPFQLTGDESQWSTDTLMAMIPVILLVSMGIVHSVNNKEPLLGFILTAIPVITGLCLKMEPSVWLLILLLVGWTGLLVISAVAKPASHKKNKPIYIQNEKHSTLPYIFITITLVLLLGFVLIFSGDDYRPPESVDEAKATVIATEEHLRYDKLNGPEIDQLSRGDLTQTHPLKYTDNVVLDLRMQMPQPMYLRGFTGGFYADGKWTEAMEGAYSGEYTGLIEWLNQENFYPWMQQDMLYRMSDNYDYVSVDVVNVNGSSKYVYLPYEAAMTGDVMPDTIDFERDYGAYAKGLMGQREYTFTAFLSRMDDYSESKISSWLEEVKGSPDWDEYAEPEAVYRRYVYDTYLKMMEEDYKALEAVNIDKCYGKTIAYTLHHIRKTFDKNFTYDISQPAAPAGSDELHYFLSESHTGNDMHFATAAALMFRASGIPARYVEGYYLSSKEMMGYTEQSDISYDVLDSDAHCWVEIYIDEIGWFPVEVIPGYYDMEKQLTDQLEDDEKIEENTHKNYEDEVPEANKPEQNKPDDSGFNPAWLILPILLLIILVYELLGRRRIKKLLASFGNVISDAHVFVMYKYVSKIMTFDKHSISADPYDSLAVISEAYDEFTAITFAEFIALVHKVRFGKISLTDEEHKKMAAYAVSIGSHVYSKQSRGNKFMMKFIFFYV